MARSDRIDARTEWQVGRRRPAFVHSTGIPAPHDLGMAGDASAAPAAQAGGQSSRGDASGDRSSGFLADAPSMRRLVGLVVTVGAHALLLALLLVARRDPQHPIIAAAQPVVVQLLPAQPTQPEPAPTVEPQLDPIEPAPAPPEIEVAQPEAPAPMPSSVVAPRPQVQLPLQPVKAAEPNVVVQPSPRAAAAPDTTPSFHAQILARLQKYRRYPPSARSRRQEGVVQIRFTMNRAGRVLDQAIISSSGHPALDREALDTLRRAQPLPAIPADQPDPLQLVVAIDFFVGR